MKFSPRLALMTGLFLALLAGCYGPGYGGGAYYTNYYAPYGAYYGGWGADYYVAPYRDGYYYRHPTGAHPSRTFRSAPDGHAMPSIPSQARASGAGHGSHPHR